MMPVAHEVAADYDGASISCPSCASRIAIAAPTVWHVGKRIQDYNT